MEPLTCHLKKSIDNINFAFSIQSHDFSKKAKFFLESFSNWKKEVLIKVKVKINNFQSEEKQYQTKSNLCNLELKIKNLESLR